MKILFICTGNTCRSPMAEGLCNKILKDKNIKNVEVKSAGISTLPNMPPSKNAVLTLQKYGIDISTHRTIELCNKLLKEADQIFVMTSGHYNQLINQYPEFAHKISMLSENDISDPYGLSLAEYERCAGEIEQSLLKIIQALNYQS